MIFIDVMYFIIWLRSSEVHQIAFISYIVWPYFHIIKQ